MGKGRHREVRLLAQGPQQLSAEAGIQAPWSDLRAQILNCPLQAHGGGPGTQKAPSNVFLALGDESNDHLLTDH